EAAHMRIASLLAAEEGQRAFLRKPSLSRFDCTGSALKFRAAAEAERLGAVVAFLGQREGVIDAKRTERRIPEQAHSDRRARLERVRGPGAIAGISAVPAQRIR